MLVTALATASAMGVAVLPRSASGLGEPTRFDVRGVVVGDARPVAEGPSIADTDEDALEPRASARRRLAWEARKRTSVETRLRPSRARLDDPSIFETPFLYWAGRTAFDPLSEAEISGLRRFVEFGGMVVIDDAAPERDGFDTSIRRALRRALPTTPLRRVPTSHTVYRSFYLLDGPYGRVQGPGYLEGIERAGRLAVAYSRHDMGGAWARDNLGSWEHPVTPGGDTQRERAIRFGVNLVMYALCLDYKDDQVHAPFIMRRRGAAP